MTEYFEDKMLQEQQERDALINEFLAADHEWTFMDADPSVAWDDPTSYHGKLAALYQEVGWERCYHREGAKFHFNVKLNGPGRYRGMQSRLAALDRPLLEEPLLDQIMEQLVQADLDFFWEEMLPDAVEDVKGHVKVYSCGRSGGYVSSPRAIETNPKAMVHLAQWLAVQRESFNSEEYGEWLVDAAIESYDEIKLEELASSRSEIPY